MPLKSYAPKGLNGVFGRAFLALRKHDASLNRPYEQFRSNPPVLGAASGEPSHILKSKNEIR